jgi:ferredoxin--NADP+ reductase
MSTTTLGPTLRDAKMHLAPPTAPGVGRVVATERCTASSKAAGFVRHVAIDVSNTPLAGNFIAGQSFGVLPPGVDAAGKPHKLRLYSIASPSFGEDGSGNVLATTVKRTIDEHWETHKLFLGVCSNYLCDLHVGDEVKVTGPSGKRFVLPANPDEHDYVFVATGTGIAPFRGMVLELLRSTKASRISLLMGSPYASDLLYDAQLRELSEASKGRFRYITAISRERQSDGKPPMYVHQRIDASDAELLSTLSSDRGLVYVCGIAGMELGVLQQLARTLPAPAREHYLQADSETMSNVQSWTRQMLHKQLLLTRRVFLEVY